MSRVVVVGAGIGELTAAALLARAGMEVAVAASTTARAMRSSLSEMEAYSGVFVSWWLI
jgi:2-polyprenyl-6-methoxyphenol hydroxylase-like FAD-dependent oxidoreductase